MKTHSFILNYDKILCVVQTLYNFMDNYQADRNVEVNSSEQSLQFNSFLQEIGFDKQKKSEHEDLEDDNGNDTSRLLMPQIQEKKKDNNPTNDKMQIASQAPEVNLRPQMPSYKQQDTKKISSITPQKLKHTILTIQAKSLKINSYLNSLKLKLSKFGLSILFDNSNDFRNVIDSNHYETFQMPSLKLHKDVTNSINEQKTLSPSLIQLTHHHQLVELAKQIQTIYRLQQKSTRITRKKKTIQPIETEEKIYRNLLEFQTNKMMDQKEQNKALSEDLVKIKRVEQKRNSIALDFAIFQAFRQDNQLIIEQSVFFLYQVLSNENISKPFKNTYSIQTIRSYFQEYFKIGFITFFKKSSIVLQKIIKSIIEELQHQPFEEFDIRLQVLSHFFRNAVSFNEYLLIKNFRYDGPGLKACLKMKMLNYSRNQLQNLKRYYIKHQHQIKYLDGGYNLQKIVNTYAFLLRKSKLERFHGQSYILVPSENLLSYIKTQRKQFKQKKPQIMEQTQIHYLSFFARNIKKFKKTPIEWSEQDIVAITKIFDSLIDNNEQANSDEIKQITKKYGRTFEKNNELFKKYQEKISLSYHQSAQQIDQDKYKQIRCFLFQAPYISYEQIQRKMFLKHGIFISMKQIASRIDDQMQILIKQLLFDYMAKSLHQIKRLSKIYPLAFVDMLSTVVPISLQESNHGQTVRKTQKRIVSFYVAVSNRGEVVCNFYLQQDSLEIVFDSLIRQLSDINIFTFRDKDFLSENWFQRSQIQQFYKKQIKIIPIPLFEEIFNPCKQIIDEIFLRLKSNTHSQSSLRILAEKTAKQVKVFFNNDVFEQQIDKSKAMFDYLRALHRKNFGVSRQQYFQDMKLLIKKKFVHHKEPEKIVFKCQKKKIEDLMTSISFRAGQNKTKSVSQEIEKKQQRQIKKKVSAIIRKLGHDDKKKAVVILKMYNERQMFLNQLVNTT